MTRPRLMVVFIDALGPRQLEAFGDRLPFAPHHRALDGILGYTSGALPTLLTGAPPERHGRMCLFGHRPDGEPALLGPLAWLGLLPRVVHERARVRRVVGRVFARTAGLTGYVALHRVPPEAFRWLDLPERADLFASDDIGGAPTFLGDARRAGLSVYTAAWRLGEQERWQVALADLRRARPDLAFLYVTELDNTLHAHGNDTPAVRAAIDRITEHLARAHDELSIGGTPPLTLLAGDHGMADIREVVDPRPILARVGVARAFADSTMLRFWGSDAAIDQARVACERSGAPGRWLDEAALRERRAPTRDAPYGRGIFVLDEGVLFAPSFLGGRMKGMHGYDLGTPSSRTAVASSQPLPDGARRLTDVAGVVRTALGLAS